MCAEAYREQWIANRMKELLNVSHNLELNDRNALWKLIFNNAQERHAMCRDYRMHLLNEVAVPTAEHQPKKE
jgi:hypothetical protein